MGGWGARLAQALRRARRRSSEKQLRLEAQPDDPLLMLRVAEECVREREPTRAVELYLRAAGRFAAQGHLSRARAVLRLAERLAPHDPAVQTQLASLTSFEAIDTEQRASFRASRGWR